MTTKFLIFYFVLFAKMRMLISCRIMQLSDRWELGLWLFFRGLKGFYESFWVGHDKIMCDARCSHVQHLRSIV